MNYVGEYMRLEERRKEDRELCIVLTRKEVENLKVRSGLKDIRRIELYEEEEQDDGGNFESARVVVEG